MQAATGESVEVRRREKRKNWVGHTMRVRRVFLWLRPAGEGSSGHARWRGLSGA